MSFELGKFFNTSPFSFDNVEYFEFLFQYELAKKDRDNENRRENVAQGMTDLAGMLGGA